MLSTEVRVGPGVPRVDVVLHLGNTACDHRVRLLFPSGRKADRFHAASTLRRASLLRATTTTATSL